jgi:peptidoglycan/LPS O-acetylase OafA/YrhL
MPITKSLGTRPVAATAALSPETSAYLDLARSIAALAVFLGHVSGQRLTGGFLWQAGPYMDPAVCVFFVLSGFVIGHVTDARETDAASYAVARLARLYSVALPAVVLTLALDAAGRAIAPGLYSADWGFRPGNPLSQAARALSFTQTLWWGTATIGSDLPYWSLNNEAWYYLIFGLAAFAPGRWRWLAALAALACGPRILALLPLWLLGWLISRPLVKRKLGRRAGWALFAASLAVAAAYEAWSWRHGRPLATMGPSWRPDLPQDVLVALLFAANLAGFRAIAPAFAAPVRLIRAPVGAFAGRSFSLYLYHLPVAQFLAAINPWPPTHPGSRLLIVGGTLAAVFALAQVTELRKRVWRGWIGALVRPPRPA